MIMTDYFNCNVRESVMCDVEWITTKRIKFGLERLKNKRWLVRSCSRGKEVKFIFMNDEERHELLLHYYKGGCLIHVPSGEDKSEAVQKFDSNIVYERDHRFSFKMEDGSWMIHVDQFHQSYWKWVENGKWSFYRSPDILFENNAYRKYLHKYRKHPYFKRPVLEVILHHRFFNGLNNFTRNEILGRTRFSPFMPMCEVLESEILREDLFDTMRYVLEQIYILGGSQFGIWKNPNNVDKYKLKRWIEFYHNPKLCMFKDKDGRLFYVSDEWKQDLKKYIIENDIPLADRSSKITAI